MDEQDGQDKELKYELITKSLIGCAFEVINELGADILESVYEKALLLALRQKGLSALSQHPVKVMFRGECIGEFYADIFVEKKVIVELKRVESGGRGHQNSFWRRGRCCEKTRMQCRRSDWIPIG
jgi:GxxExxY protein